MSLLFSLSNYCDECFEKIEGSFLKCDCSASGVFCPPPATCKDNSIRHETCKAVLTAGAPRSSPPVNEPDFETSSKSPSRGLFGTTPQNKPDRRILTPGRSSIVPVSHFGPRTVPGLGRNQAHTGAGPLSGSMGMTSGEQSKFSSHQNNFGLPSNAPSPFNPLHQPHQSPNRPRDATNFFGSPAPTGPKDIDERLRLMATRGQIPKKGDELQITKLATSLNVPYPVLLSSLEKTWASAGGNKSDLVVRPTPGATPQKASGYGSTSRWFGSPAKNLAPTPPVVDLTESESGKRGHNTAFGSNSESQKIEELEQMLQRSNQIRFNALSQCRLKVQDLNSKIKQLEAENARLSDENRQLQSRPLSVAITPLAFSEEQAAAANSLVGFATQFSDLHKHATDILSSLQDAVVSGQVASMSYDDISGFFSSLSANNSAVQIVLGEVQERLQCLSNLSNGDVNALHSELTRCQAEIQRLEAELQKKASDIDSDDAKKLNHRVTMAEKKAADLVKELSRLLNKEKNSPENIALQKKYDEEREKHANTRTTSDHYYNQNTSLKEQVAALNKEKTDFQNTISGLEQQLSDLTREVEELKVERDRIQSELDEALKSPPKKPRAKKDA
ncbi:hypothetical protein BJ508DRAFT_323070 [Ascobolus immersus RN42]|uniref:Uncharacterized protein n=1 Tax=Ascobolus immersus RN42 TaxID=1160509 RepID=A0A3N4IJJ7_ASCIM|nr:hypothetical protein BJ508DRAFT_323070 [Ascobolus immersus RN42]